MITDVYVAEYGLIICYGSPLRDVTLLSHVALCNINVCV